METLQQVVDALSYAVWEFGIPFGGEEIPIVVIILVGAGLYLTLRTGFVQLRRFGHGVAVTSGKYDDPSEPGDVTHFQALTTALSATVGIGNIAGVALAIHFGGPGALFWMWVTAVLGMATKFSEVTLAQHYRDENISRGDSTMAKLRGTVAGGPMYYIEKGLGKNWKPLAILFAFLLMTVSFFTGNAIQANTVADTMAGEFGVVAWISGLATASIVALVILGGIRRIGRVTSILAPGMAAIYVLGALVILAFNADQILPTLGRVFTEAFNPQAGVAGTGTGAFLFTMMWGVRRGLFSNEAGMGSAPIAHSAAKTDEPVSEGVVALLEPFIDTIVICSLTALVILSTGAWEAKVPSALDLGSGDVSYVQGDEAAGGQFLSTSAPDDFAVQNGHPTAGPNETRFAWHEVPVDTFYTDPELTQPFSGTIDPAAGVARTEDGRALSTLYGRAVESGAPLTQLAFERGLPGGWGGYIVLISVLLFAISTAISWSYYGDRCANYLFGSKAILPYKLVFLALHIAGAVVSLSVIWAIGDVFLGMVILPNLLAVVLLSGKLREITRSYFERKPWRSQPGAAGDRDGRRLREEEGEKV